MNKESKYTYRNDALRKNVGLRIRGARLKRGLSLQGAADKTGIAYGTYNAAETKGSVTPESLVAISRVLKVSIDYLMTGEESHVVHKALPTTSVDPVKQREAISKAVEEKEKELREEFKEVLGRTKNVKDDQYNSLRERASQRISELERQVRTLDRLSDAQQKLIESHEERQRQNEPSSVGKVSERQWEALANGRGL